ncbi:MAG: hypothetical protein ABR968_03655 [Bacteroidales bacterium]|jgi:hypothetical protein
MNHIIVFSELTTGKFKTMLSGKCLHKDILSIVRSVNSKVIYKNVPLSQANSLSDTFNYQALGYKSTDDFKLTTSTGKSPEFVNITITPLCYYNLHDNFSLTQAPDKRSNIIQGLLVDEFERIKNRALYTLESSHDEKDIKVYAVKNRMFVKTCFHNHKAVFHDLFTLYPDYLRNPDAFIHYYLNFFLIRLRMFYEKLFEDFLGKSKKTEKQLLAELFQMNPAVMYKQNNTITTTLDNDSDILARESDYGQDSDNSLLNAYDIIGKAHNIPPQKVQQLVELIGKVKWNGNKNILGDAIYQFMQKHNNKNIPLLDASHEVISTIVSLIGIDDQDHPLSKYTIKTHLQSGKSDKRPKSGSKKKIDIAPVD